MPCQLPADCLIDIFEYLYDDKNTLYSCLLVNSLYCETAVRILWRNVWKFYNNNKPYISLSIINTLIACLPKESEEILHKNGINIAVPIQKPPLFNYASFCKVISIYKIEVMIQHTLKKHKKQSNTSADLKILLSQEILKMLLNQITSLKVLKCNNSRYEDLYLLSEAKIHLSNLAKLRCDSDICPKFISHNLQSLTINFRNLFSKWIRDLISSQNNLKILKIANLQYISNYEYKEIILSLTKHSLTLTRLTLKNCKITKQFIAMFKNLQELNLDQNDTFYQLRNAYFLQLKILKITYNRYSLKDGIEILINFLKINGNNLTEFYIYRYYHEKSLNLALAKYCPNLKIIYTYIRDEETLKLILNNCQYLEIIEFCYDSRDWLDSKIFFKVLANYSQKYFYGLILDFYSRLPIDELYQDLKEFFINWQGRTSQRSLSLIFVISETYYITKSAKINMKDIKLLIDKYKKLGIIKKFELKR
ncbi:hypothetical protein RhiirA4_466017 [Rhizophagus irregularis]|uniref:F-box domain-containing protein n=1 Tax=Rhizophagus irregularis TaxID=588596 RepID=A0A2I1GTA2_9GLOM|nr:hypothetical protein RhiirA4_460343 [Rhizophagus irregularis]PKY49871.1 hypothetical protein RhiirA4_466017 [Rhizophagus irregularis]